jgi:hypothetical protein
MRLERYLREFEISQKVVAGNLIYTLYLKKDLGIR